MLALIRGLGAMRDHSLRESLKSDVQKVARLCWNNMRFLPAAKVAKKWYDLGELTGKRSTKMAAEEFYASCLAIVKLCEALWQT